MSIFLLSIKCKYINLVRTKSVNCHVPIGTKIARYFITPLQLNSGKQGLTFWKGRYDMYISFHILQHCAFATKRDKVIEVMICSAFYLAYIMAIKAPTAMMDGK